MGRSHKPSARKSSDVEKFEAQEVRLPIRASCPKPRWSIAQFKLACADPARRPSAKDGCDNRVLAAGDAPKMIATEIWPKARPGKQLSQIDQIRLLR